MKKYLLPLILILLLTFTLIGNCAWLSGWDYRIELAIGDYAGDIGAEVVWFPVTIFLKDANGDSTKVFEEVGANSRKIALTKNDGTTELKGEIEDWSYDAGTPANSTAVIHTSADGWTINANTSIWLYYDNDHDDNANVDVINTTPGAAVWDNDFVAVWHMVDDTTSTIKDSTSNNNDGTKTSADNPIEAAGKVGQAQDFSSDYIDISTGAAGLAGVTNFSSFTVETIFYLSSIDVKQRPFTSKSADGYFTPYIVAADNKMDFMFRDASAWHQIYSNSGLSAETWYYYAYRWTGSALNQIENITTQTDTSDPSTTYTASSAGFVIGSLDDHTQNFNGKQDEFRVSLSDRTDSWCKGTYNSLWDALLTYGSEEEAPPTGIIWNTITITKWNTKTITIPINTQ